MRRGLVKNGAVAGIILLGILFWTWSPEHDPVDPPERGSTEQSAAEAEAMPTAAGEADGRFVGPAAARPPEEMTVLEVVVVNARSEEPIEGAAVSFSEHGLPAVEDPEGRLVEVAPGAATDAGGGAQLHLQRGVTYTILATADRFVPAVRRFEAPASQRFSRLRVSLARRSLLRGRVVDQDGAPLAGVPVWTAPLRDDEEVAVDYLRGANFGLQTAIDGGFEFVSLAPARYQVTAAAEDYLGASTEVQLEDGAEQEMTLALTRADRLAILEGLVTDSDGRPIRFASVELVREAGGREQLIQRDYTSREGVYEIRTARGTDLRLRVDRDGFEVWETRLDLLEDRDLPVQLRPRPRIRVRVLDPEGRVVDDAAVIGDGPIHGRRGVKLGQLLHPDRNADTFSARQFPLRVYAHAQHRGLGVSEIVKIERHQPDIELQLRPVGRLRGRAVDAEGRAVRAFSLQVLAIDGDRDLYITGRRVETDDGTFELTGVPTGRLSIRFESADAGTAHTDVRVTPDRVAVAEVRLQPADGSG